MSYTKQTWQAGDEITSAKLNHLEDGINNVATEVANFPVEVNNPQDGDTLIYNAAEQKWVSGSNSGGFLAVHDNDGTFDKTWKEIHDALANEKYVFVIESDESEIYHYTVTAASYNGEQYVVIANKTLFTSETENGYPSIISIK